MAESDGDFAVQSMIAAQRSRIWADDEVPVPEIPEPEVRGRLATLDETPRGAKQVVNAAEKHGWDVAVYFARGPWLEADGVTVPYMVDSIAVRGRRGDAHFLATWVRKPTGDPDKYEFSSAHWRVGPTSELGLLSSTDLKERIKT